MSGKIFGVSGLLAAAAILVFVSGLPAEGEKKLAESELALRKQSASLAVHIAAAGLGGQCRETADPARRVALIRAFIDPIRFYPDDSGYFYVYDQKCVNIAHATQKDLVGKDLTDYRDGKGKLVIRELLRAAQSGGGFVEYWWVKPGAEGERMKIGYVEPIPGTDYFIGTGVYLD